VLSLGEIAALAN